MGTAKQMWGNSVNRVEVSWDIKHNCETESDIVIYS